MTRETIYRSLLRLYPPAFRREYEDQLLQTFDELSRDNPQSSVRFVGFLLGDVCRSVVHEHVDTWTSGMGRFALQWVSACSLGVMVSGAAAYALVVAVNLLVPPRVDAHGFLHYLGPDLPSGVHGALIGLVIGSAQALALRRHVGHGVFRRGAGPAVWALMTAVAGSVGFPLGLAVANGIGFGFLFRPVGYFAGVTLLGTLVGVAQSLLLKSRKGSAARWILWSAFAIPAGMLAGIACESLFGPTGPRTWQGFALILAVYPAVIGFVIGTLTVGPLTSCCRDET